MTLEQMRNLSRQDHSLPGIQELASLCGDPIGLDAYLRAHWVYKPDPDWAEYVMGPQYQLEQASENGFYYGDCDDAATLAGCLAIAMGYPCRFVAYRMAGNDEFSHVNLRCNGGVDYDVDPTVDLSRLPITTAEEIMEVIL